jgi:precorrin-4/cobalt-precorrin-4 C11-methyltransferase
MILVGRVLTAEDFADSRLYAPDFAHRYRRKKSASKPLAKPARETRTS